MRMVHDPKHRQASLPGLPIDSRPPEQARQAVMSDTFKQKFEKQLRSMDRAQRRALLALPVIALAAAAWVGFLIYVGWHFVSKFW